LPTGTVISIVIAIVVYTSITLIVAVKITFVRNTVNVVVSFCACFPNEIFLQVNALVLVVTAAAAPLRHRGIDDQGALVGERPSALNP
jgi:hypothetical protein